MARAHDAGPVYGTDDIRLYRRRANARVARRSYIAVKIWLRSQIARRNIQVKIIDGHTHISQALVGLLSGTLATSGLVGCNSSETFEPNDAELMMDEALGPDDTEQEADDETRCGTRGKESTISSRVAWAEPSRCGTTDVRARSRKRAWKCFRKTLHRRCVARGARCLDRGRDGLTTAACPRWLLRVLGSDRLSASTPAAMGLALLLVSQNRRRHVRGVCSLLMGRQLLGLDPKDLAHRPRPVARHG